MKIAFLVQKKSSTKIQQELHEIGIRFEEHNRLFEQQVYASITALEKKMIDLFEKFRNEQRENLQHLRKEAFNNDGGALIYKNSAVDERLNNLEMHNNILQRRLNRADIIVKGLPKHIKNIRVPVLKIASLCGLPISHDGIQHCTYIHNGRSVLVKFNSVQHRDKLMMNFSKKRHLILKDIIGGDITSKVFLNDHLTPAAANLISTCRDLRMENKIIKYKFINTDVPKVRVTMLDNNVKILNLQQCSSMLSEAPYNDSINLLQTQNNIDWDPIMSSSSTVNQNLLSDTQLNN